MGWMDDAYSQPLTPAARMPTSKPIAPPSGEEEDEPEAAEVGWLSSAHSKPVRKLPQKRSLARKAWDAVGDAASLVDDAAGIMGEDIRTTQRETGKAFLRGVNSVIENVAVNAPNAAVQFAETATRRFGDMTPERQERWDRMQENIEEGWNKPLQGWIDTAQSYLAGEPTDGGFVQQFKRNPIRTLSVGLAENAPQFLAQVGATAVNPVLGLGMAGASEGGAAWKEAKEQGASDEDAIQAAGLTALPNMLLEYLPGAKALKEAYGAVPTQEVAGLLGNVLKQAIREGGTEFIQEANSVLAALATYAGDEGLTFADLSTMVSPENLERYGAAGVFGAILGGGTAPVIAARSSRRDVPPEADPAVASPGAANGAGADANGRSAQEPPVQPIPDNVRRFPVPQQEEDAPPPQPRETSRPADRARPVEPTEDGTQSHPASAVEPQAAPPAVEPPPTLARKEEAESSEVEAAQAEPPVMPAAPETSGRAVPQEATPSITRGKTDTSYTSRGTAVEFDYAVVEADAVRTSHDDGLEANPLYPAELQPRDRDRAASATQVSRIEQQLNPALVAESAKAADGAPIIGPDGLVEGGNARTIGIRRAYRAGARPAEEYRRFLLENAERFGLTREAVGSHRMPLLVRVRRSEVSDRAEFARELNESGTATMSSTERARSDAQRISPEMLEKLSIPESGEVNWLSNKAFVEGFTAKLAPDEHGELFDQNGSLSVQGQQRLRNAVLARAFGDGDAIAKLIESSDNNVRTVGAAMMREAPRMALLRSRMEAGALHDLDISGDVSAAVRKLSGLRSAGAKVSDYLSQNEMFGRELSEEARELLTLFDKHGRSGKAVGEILRTYTELVEGLGDPQQQGLFGSPEIPTKLSLIKQAVDEAEFNRQRDIFGTSSQAGRAFTWNAKASSSHDPAATKLYRKLYQLVHPDRAKKDDLADYERRNRFLVEANLAYEVDDVKRLEQILEAWEAGKEIDQRPSGRYGRPKSPPGSNEPPRRSGGPPPPPPPGPGDNFDSEIDREKPRRSVDTAPRKLRLELPEIVELLGRLGEGTYPRVKRVLRSARGTALGTFRHSAGVKGSAGVDVRADVAENPEFAAWVLAHEAGHWVDSLSTTTMDRGNILGSLGSLKRYMQQMLDELPSDPSKVFTDKERARWRSAALREATRELGMGNPDLLFAARKLYAEKLQEEMASRRLVDRETVHNELRKVSSSWRGPFKKGDPYRDHPRELYADGFSALLNDPGLVSQEAPTFQSLFFNYLERKPEVRAIYEDIQARIEGGEEAVADARLDRYLDSLRRGGEARAEALATDHGKVTMGEALVDSLIDRKSVLYRHVRRARKASAALDPSRNPVYWVEEAAYHSSEAAWYLTRINEEVLGPVRRAGISDTEFGAVLGLNRAAGERSHLFNPLGLQGEFAESTRERLERRLGKEKSDVIEKAAMAWWRLRKENLERVRKSGAYSASFVRKALRNPSYVKFFVAKHITTDAAKKATGHIHAQVGTLAEIGNPLVETVLADLALMRVAHRTQTAKAILTFYEDNIPNEVEPARRGQGGQLTESNTRGQGTVYYLDGGVTRAFYVSERVAKFMEAETETANATYQAYNLVTRPLKALFVDKNPFWAIWNLFKDSLAFSKQVVTSKRAGAGKVRHVTGIVTSPVTASFQTFRYLIKALPDTALEVLLDGNAAVRAIRRFERRFPPAGALGAAAERYVQRHTQDLAAMRRDRMVIETGTVSDALSGSDSDAMDLLLSRFGVVEAPQRNAAMRLMSTLWDALGKPGEFSERLVKIAGYKYLRDNRDRIGISDKEVSHRVRTLVGTPDLMRRGDAFKITNSILLFSNVGKEGWRSAIEAAALSPGEYAMKSLAYSVVPKLVMIGAAYGLFGDELEEWFRKVSDYDKSNFIVIPLGTTPSGKAVYTRIPLDHTGQVVSSLVWRVFSDQTRLAEVFTFLNQNSPISFAALHPYITGAHATFTYLEGKNPQDSYTGGPMVSAKVFEAAQGDAPPEARMRAHLAFARSMWGELGGDLLVRFNTESSDEAATLLEEALELPLVGPALHRFVKVSDQGETERLRRISEDARAEQRRRSISLDEIVEEGLKADPRATAQELYRAARSAGLDPGRLGDFKKRVERYQDGHSGDPLRRALTYATSKKEKQRLSDTYLDEGEEN